MCLFYKNKNIKKANNKIILKKICFLFVIFYCCSLFCQNIFASQTLWVSSKNAKLKKHSNASSATIKKLSIGEELRVKSKSKRWLYVVTLTGDAGWIYKGKVSEIKPDISDINTDDESNSLGSLFGSISGGGISADSADTSRSIRGLSPETKDYADNTNTPKKYQQALDKVLSQKITENQIEMFLKSGKIGEYAN